MNQESQKMWKRYHHIQEGYTSQRAIAFWAQATSLYGGAFYTLINYDYVRDFNHEAFQEIYRWNSRLGVDYMLVANGYWQQELAISVSLQDRMEELYKRYDEVEEYFKVLDSENMPFDEHAVVEFNVWDSGCVFINLPDSELPKWEEFLEKHGYVVR